MRAIAALLVLLGAAWAGPKRHPACVRNHKTALEIARTRGKLIFLTVIVDNDNENRMVIDRVFRDKSFIKISNEFVCLLANWQDEHGKVAVKDPKTGKRVQRCADCPSITCMDHMLLAQNFARGFFPGSEARTPIHFVIDTELEIVHTIKNGSFEAGFNHVEPDIVVGELKKVLKKHGRGLSEIEYQGMLKNLSDARAARARKNLTLELEKLMKVVALDRKIVGVEEAKKRVKEIDAIAAKELAALDETLAAMEWEKALDGLERIAATYPGTLTAGAAKTKRAELLERKEVKKLLKAAELYERALQYKKRGKLELARKKFAECVRRGKGTKYAELAQKELDAMGGG